MSPLDFTAAGLDEPALAPREPVADSPRALMIDELRDAANEYHRQTMRLEVAERRTHEAENRGLPIDVIRKFERWAYAVQSALSMAEQRLMARILLWFGRLKSIGQLGNRAFEPCAFELDCRLYVVGLDEDSRPVLIVVDFDRSFDGAQIDGD